MLIITESSVPARAFTSGSARVRIIIRNMADQMRQRMEDFLIPSRIRSIRPAPKFWLTKVALALAMLARGMFPIMTILRAAVWAAMMEVPSVLMEPCRMTEPMEKMEFIRPMEKPVVTSSLTSFLL